jgi:hypothetical protein
MFLPADPRYTQQAGRNRDVSTSFCEQKGAKKRYLRTALGFGPDAATQARSGVEVFWCFFSKKNSLLPLALAGFHLTNGSLLPE